jgi:hypothetical protein
MRRREFVALLGGARMSWSLVAQAQHVGKPYRVGIAVGTAPLADLVGPDPATRTVRAFVHTL